MTVTLANTDAILKNRYAPELKEQVVARNVLFGMLSQHTNQTDGRQLIGAAHTGRSISTYAHAAGSAYIPADRQKYANITVPWSYMHHAIQLNGEILTNAATDAGSFTRAMNREMEGARDDIGSQLNRIAWSDGSGRIATIQTTANNATQDVWAAGIDFASNPGENGTRFIRVGDTLAIGTAAELAAGTGVSVAFGTVLSITNEGRLVFTGAVDTTAEDLVVRAVSATNTSYLNEFAGVSLAVGSAGTYLGINRGAAGNKYWQSAEVATNAGAGTAAISIPTLQKLLVDMTRAGKGQPSVFIGDPAWLSEYGELLMDDKRYAGLQLQGGFEYSILDGRSGLSFAGIPCYSDPDARYNEIYALDLTTFEMPLIEDFKWAQALDSPIMQRVSGSDSFEAVMRWFGGLVCWYPNKNGKITKVTMTLPT